MAVRLSGDYKRSATVGFWSRLVASPRWRFARPAAGGPSRRGLDALGRVVANGRQLR